ncbi:MAG: DEAD/DEAH box helicase [bacterium]
MKNLKKGTFDSLKFYRLNLAARRLLLVQSFQDIISLPALRNIESYAYQTETAIRVLRRYQGRALLCDEVGLGKTIEAGIVLKEYVMRGLVKKALILTPPGLVRQWKEEMSSKFGLDFITHEDEPFREAGEKAWATFPFIIASINYAKRQPHSENIHRIHYDLVLVDEAHHLRNRTSVAWQFVNALDKKYILLLTATPVQNDLEELFNLITILKPGQLDTLRNFKKEFVEKGDPRKPKNTEKLQALLSDCMVRNTRSQIDRSLPPRRAHTVKLKFSAPEEALYNQVAEFLRSLYPASFQQKPSQTGGEFADAAEPEGGISEVPSADMLLPQATAPAVKTMGKKVQGVNKIVIQTLQRELGSSPAAFAETAKNILNNPKLAPEIRTFFNDVRQKAVNIGNTAKGTALLSLLRSLEGEKAVVFTHYRKTLETLHNVLAANGIPCGVYHGGLSTAEKDAAVRDFQDNLPVLLSTEAGGEGRNLQFCRTLINYDLPYNPMRIEQRVGRIHRIGQKRPVSIYNFAAEGTLEDYLLKILDEKINMFELVIGEMDMVLGQIEEEGDFEDLLMDIWMRSKSEQELIFDMDALGERLLQAKKDYLETKELDGKIFAQDFEAV